MTIKNTLEGGHYFEPPRLMPTINRGGHFSLTEMVIKNRLAKSNNRGRRLKMPPRLIDINRGGCFNINVSKNILAEASIVNQPRRLIWPNLLAHTTHLRVLTAWGEQSGLRG